MRRHSLPATARSLFAGLAILLVTFPAKGAEHPMNVILTESGVEHVVGIVDMDEGFHLAIASVQPGKRAWLEQLVNEANEQEVMHVDVPPPTDAPQFYANVSRIVPRSDPEFLGALNAYLETYFDVKLR